MKKFVQKIVGVVMLFLSIGGMLFRLVCPARRDFRAEFKLARESGLGSLTLQLPASTFEDVEEFGKAILSRMELVRLSTDALLEGGCLTVFSESRSWQYDRHQSRYDFDLGTDSMVVEFRVWHDAAHREEFSHCAAALLAAAVEQQQQAELITCKIRSLKQGLLDTPALMFQLRERWTRLQALPEGAIGEGWQLRLQRIRQEAAKEYISMFNNAAHRLIWDLEEAAQADAEILQLLTDGAMSVAKAMRIHTLEAQRDQKLPPMEFKIAEGLLAALQAAFARIQKKDVLARVKFVRRSGKLLMSSQPGRQLYQLEGTLVLIGTKASGEEWITTSLSQLNTAELQSCGIELN